MRYTKEELNTILQTADDLQQNNGRLSSKALIHELTKQTGKPPEYFKPIELLLYIKSERQTQKQAQREQETQHTQQPNTKQKRYREANKDKIREYKKKYTEANKDKIREYQKKYREANKDKFREYQRRYNMKHRKAKQ